MSGHTPGPWGFMFNTEWTDNFLLGPEDEERPGECFGTFLEGGMVLEDDAKNLANASLIAAAPELLAALKQLLPLAQAFEKQASKGAGGRRGGPVFEKARAAIAKAEGSA